MSHQINISYELDKFMKYKECNVMMPVDLLKICMENGGIVMLKESTIKEISTIITTFLNGRNPNDIVFKNSIVESLNKITQKNYTTILETLKNLAYSKTEHFVTLATDILVRAMNDTVAIKDIELPPGQQTLSDIYAMVAIDFFPLLIKENDRQIKFSSVFLDLCKKYFDDFTDQKKLLDQNNAHRVDSFKGFCHFLGLIYTKGLINDKVVYQCLVKLADLIFCQKWESNEAENIYEGYRKIIKHTLNILEKKHLVDNDKIFIAKLGEIHTGITTKNNTILSKTNTQRLKRSSMLYHDEIEKRINKLASKNVA